MLAVLADIREELPGDLLGGIPTDTVSISTNATWRQVEWPRWTVLSYERPLHLNPSAGTRLYSLQATSQALQPMHSVESVRKALVGKMLTSHE